MNHDFKHILQNIMQGFSYVLWWFIILCLDPNCKCVRHEKVEHKWDQYGTMDIIYIVFSIVKMHQSPKMINGYINSTFNSQDTLISQKDQWLGFDCVVLQFIFWMKALNLLHWIVLGWSLNDNIDDWNQRGDQFVNWWFLFND